MYTGRVTRCEICDRETGVAEGQCERAIPPWDTEGRWDAERSCLEAAVERWRARAMAAEASLDIRDRTDEIGAQLIEVSKRLSEKRRPTTTIAEEVETATVERIATWLERCWNDASARYPTLADAAAGLRAGAWKEPV